MKHGDTTSEVSGSMSGRETSEAGVEFGVGNDLLQPSNDMFDHALEQLVQDVGGDGGMNVAMREIDPERIRDEYKLVVVKQIVRCSVGSTFSSGGKLLLSL